ncbi:MAG: hypothetical protein ABSH56_12610 [Bryobacteraceae bacterium]|jgi:hypothetical protein
MRSWLPITILLGAAALAAAQNGPAPGGGFPGAPGGRGVRVLGAEAGVPARVVKNAPYSADLITETTQVLADGNRLHQITTARIYRDGQGRTRREQSLSGLGALTGRARLPRLVFINDPVAGVNYALNPEDHTASRSAWMHPAYGRGVSPRLSRHGDDKVESLGAGTMEGVAVRGTRTTTTIPAGRIGNELPIVVVTETWYSADLDTAILTRRNDPRSGETVSRMSNLVRAEPPASMFQLPADFRVVDAPRPGRWSSQ